MASALHPGPGLHVRSAHKWKASARVPWQHLDLECRGSRALDRQGVSAFRHPVEGRGCWWLWTRCLQKSIHVSRVFGPTCVARWILQWKYTLGVSLTSPFENNSIPVHLSHEERRSSRSSHWKRPNLCQSHSLNPPPTCTYVSSTCMYDMVSRQGHCEQPLSLRVPSA